MVTFQRPDGAQCSGYYSEPSGDSTAPAIVVIQEWWGLNEQIKGVAERLTRAGYRALVPDLYRGKRTVDVQEAEHFMAGLDFADAAAQDIRGAVQHLKQTSARVGVTGFCMGGALALLSAVHVPDASAVVIWYGYPPLDYIDAAKIGGHLLGHFALDDAFFPIAGVDELEKKLAAADVSFEFHRYAARHAFANETLINPPIPAGYNEEAAELAWQRTLSFFGRRLKQYWA